MMVGTGWLSALAVGIKTAWSFAGEFMTVTIQKALFLSIVCCSFLLYVVLVVL